MTRYAFILGGSCIEVAGAFVSPHTGQQYATDWLDKASAEDRAGISLLAVTEALPAPVGRRIVSTSLKPISGVPTEVHVLEDVPLDERKTTLLQAVDAERDRLQQLDFTYAFGELIAVDDAGQPIAAGDRKLQMRPADQLNWQALQSQAVVAVMAGQGGVLMPMRAEDNWNVQTTAADVLTVTSAMFMRNAGLLFFGGALKSQVRAAMTAAELDAINISIGWPG